MDIDKLDLSDNVVIDRAYYTKASRENGEVIQLSAHLKHALEVKGFISITQDYTREVGDFLKPRFLSPKLNWQHQRDADQESALVYIELFRLAYKMAAFMDTRIASFVDDYLFPDPMIIGMLQRMKPEELVKP